MQALKALSATKETFSEGYHADTELAILLHLALFLGGFSLFCLLFSLSGFPASGV